jgi:hypothetical protein
MTETAMSITSVPLLDEHLNTVCHTIGHHWHDERVGFGDLYLRACRRCGVVRGEEVPTTRLV